MVIKKVDIKDEKELQDLLFKNPEAIEEGMEFVAKEVLAHDNRRIDLLGFDSKGSLVAVELKIEATEDSVIQLLDYADFAYRHFRILAERYSDLKLMKEFDPASNIRIMVVAENFNHIFKRIVPHTDWEIEAFRFQAVKTESGEKSIICLSEEIPELPYLPEEKPLTISYHLDYITNDEARESAEILIDYVKSLGEIEIVPTQSYIGFKKKRGFASIYTRRSYITLWHRDENDDEWQTRVDSPEDINDDLKEAIAEAYEAAS